MHKKSLKPHFETKIHPSTFKHVVTYLSSQSPQEGCGVLFGRDFLAVKFLPIPNSHSRPYWNFIMDPEIFANEVPKVLDNDYELVAFVHSHPGMRDATPSAYDIASYDSISYPNVVHVIVAWYKNDMSNPFATVWKYPSIAGRLVQSHEGSKLI